MLINKLLANEANFSSGRVEKIAYIVVHYTANDGDLAKSNCVYFQTAGRNASAHYFVDETEVWQSVLDKDTAWHCGTSGSYKHKYCRNSNSLGVEICSEKDTKGEYYFNTETIENAISLVKYLMEKYDISADNVIRHYDVTGKICPAPFVNNTILWANFKNRLEEEDYLKVERSYKYGENEQTFTVINDEGENYIRVKDLAALLGKTVTYDNDTKVTTII